MSLTNYCFSSNIYMKRHQKLVSFLFISNFMRSDMLTYLSLHITPDLNEIAIALLALLGCKSFVGEARVWWMRKLRIIFNF